MQESPLSKGCCQSYSNSPPKPIPVKPATYTSIPSCDRAGGGAHARPGYVFAAKGEFMHQLLRRELQEGLGAIFIVRIDATCGAEDVEKLVAALRKGENLLVIPEGTVTRDA
ncbi:MAG TPA: 1-acyl-sn-glycerol-3-phosphate acyltransferase [Noviherbaspirillum sp.]|nr:1-acyl-sn-glycerol-3-phosphate acyltransferase [Noviherbaspirillum sp.]